MFSDQFWAIAHMSCRIIFLIFGENAEKNTEEIAWKSSSENAKQLQGPTKFGISLG